MTGGTRAGGAGTGAGRGVPGSPMPSVPVPGSPVSPSAPGGVSTMSAPETVSISGAVSGTTTVAGVPLSYPSGTVVGVSVHVPGMNQPE